MLKAHKDKDFNKLAIMLSILTIILNVILNIGKLIFFAHYALSYLHL